MEYSRDVYAISYRKSINVQVPLWKKHASQFIQVSNNMPVVGLEDDKVMYYGHLGVGDSTTPGVR
jgi:hypothetical protein